MKKNKKGFTLAELLIVFAIIAVLVAISIPIFTSQLRKARLAANKANARAALSAAIAQFIEAPEEDKLTTIADTDQYRYFRYDTTTGQCTYEGMSNTSPNNPKIYDFFANIGYYKAGGKGISDVSQWKENTKSQVRGNENKNDVPGILTKRTYRYWDVAMQGDGTFMALVCLW
jgi:prepilin-type N-terminal cleavage/methylation domain-containing protein